MTFETLFESFDWMSIRDCPGRFILRTDDGLPPRISDLLKESGNAIRRFEPENCPDAVLISTLEGGGAVISYERSDGTQLHTLNTQEGFERKIDQLGIRFDFSKG